MNTVAQGEALMKSAAQKTRDGKSWSGWCQSFVYRFTGASKSADTAALAYQMSGHIQSKDATKAIPGAIHWWSDGGAGHVAVAIGKGGLAAMASATAAQYGTKWGTDSGAITVAEYNQHHTNLNYLGWTYDFEGQYVVDVRKYLDAQTAAEEAAAAKAKADAAAKAKAAADKAAAEKAAAAKVAADKAAAEKALAAAAEAAIPIPEVKSAVLIAKEKSHPEVYLILEGTNKVHLTADQYHVYRVLGAALTEVPDGSLAAFKTVTT